MTPDGPCHYGLLLATALLCFVGRPAIAAVEDGLERGAPTSEASRAIDLAAYRIDRQVDHEFWARTSAPATLWLRDSEPCAYRYPASGAPARSPASTLRAQPTRYAPSLPTGRMRRSASTFPAARLRQQHPHSRERR
jgi:hypothetical protein